MRYRLSKNLIPLIILAFYLSIALTSLSSIWAEESTLDEAHRQLFEALQVLDEAESQGADQSRLRPIADRLNEALRLLEEAEELGLGEEAMRMAQDSTMLSRDVKAQARLATEEGMQKTLYSRIVTWSLVPVASLAIAFIVTRGYTWYLRWTDKKLLAMTIRRKPKRD